MLNLETKKTDFNCYEQILWSIISFFSASDSAPMIFADSWGFDFSNNESLIGNQIYIQKSRDLLVDVIGLQRENNNFKNTEEFLEVLEQEMIKEHPVIGWVDSYYSPWDINYKKFHGPHALIFLGVNREENVIYCSDRYYSPRVENLPIQNLAKMCGGFTTFEQVTLRYGMSKEQCYSLLKECLYQLITDDMFGKIERFGSYLKVNFDISKEIDEFDNPERAPIITALNSIAHGRKAFNRSLEYVKLKFRQYELDYFIDKVKQPTTNGQI